MNKFAEETAFALLSVAYVLAMKITYFQKHLNSKSPVANY